MASPVLPDLALDALRAVDEAGMTATAYRGVKTTGPAPSFTKTWIYPEPGIRSRLNPLAVDSPLRADQPSASRKWDFSVPMGTTIKDGDHWKVVGETSGEDWTRVVSVDEVLFPRSEELRRRAICSDVEANP
jgi:hypothetical protein